MAALLGGCSSNPASAPTELAAAGEPCVSGTDCASGLCDVVSGKSVCVDCRGSYGDSVYEGTPSSSACIDGHKVACAALPPSTCGCSCPTGTFCSVAADGQSGRCVPALAPGAVCDADAKCASGWCFRCAAGGQCVHGEGVCSAPLGGPCDSVLCEACHDGACTAHCTADEYQVSDCPSGMRCLNFDSSTSAYGECFASCTPTAASDAGAANDASASADAADAGGTSDGCPPGATCQPYANPQRTAIEGYACY